MFQMINGSVGLWRAIGMTNTKKKIEFLKKSLQKREVELINETRSAIDGMLEDGGLKAGILFTPEVCTHLTGLLIKSGGKPIEVNYMLWKG